MNKDTLAAIIIGVSLGALAAAAIFILPKFTQPKNEKTAEKKSDISAVQTAPLPSPSADALFAELTPRDGEIFYKGNTASVSGKLINSGKVIILSGSEEKVLQTDKSGNFQTTLKLVPGINQIVFSALLAEGREETRNIFVAQITENE